MEYIDARRLTGPSLLWNKPGSILEVRCTAREADWLIERWEGRVRNMLKAVGWGEETTIHRKLSGGVSCAFSAPIDALYAASAINEWAWECCDNEANGEPQPDFAEKVSEISAAIADEVNPPLLNLQQAAASHGVSFLWDDDDVSVGLGCGSQMWPFRELPDPETLDWSRFHDVPAGMVTGTNGKTTTVRLAMHILQCAEKNVGLSSTDWIGVNEHIIERGDWSGPGGARHVLREQAVDVAILETARGGLLRRGLGVDKADAALITNIAEDHLGDYGSQNLQELLDVKWIVSHAVEQSGSLILNADDELLVNQSGEYTGNLIWFSLRDDNPIVIEHVKQGGLAFVLSKGELLRLEGEETISICSAAEIPIAMGGAARHNIANALGAAALTDRLGTTLEHIRTGLLTMTQDDNPGRSNVYPVNDFHVLVDFAHNPAAFSALFDMARALPAKRRLLSFGQAGDRPDDLIRELAQGAWAIGLDVVIVSELAAYHRGREYGDVFEIIKDELVKCGTDVSNIWHFDEELESLDAALEWADEGDLVIMLALGGSKPIQERLAEFMNRK